MAYLKGTSEQDWADLKALKASAKRTALAWQPFLKLLLVTAIKHAEILKDSSLAGTLHVEKSSNGLPTFDLSSSQGPLEAHDFLYLEVLACTERQKKQKQLPNFARVCKKRLAKQRGKVIFCHQ